MLERGLQLLHAIAQDLPQRVAEQGVALAVQPAGGGLADGGRAQVRVDQHHAGGRLVQHRLRQAERALQLDLGAGLGEGEVQAERPAVGGGERVRLGAHQDPSAVPGGQRELVDPARTVTVGQLEVDGFGVGRAQRPAGQPVAAHRLPGGPAEQPGRLPVPVGDHPVAVERGESDLHAVEQDREQTGIRVQSQRRCRRPLGVHSAAPPCGLRTGV